MGGSDKTGDHGWSSEPREREHLTDVLQCSTDAEGAEFRNCAQESGPGGNGPRARRRLQTMGKETSKGQSLEAAHLHQEGPRSER